MIMAHILKGSTITSCFCNGRVILTTTTTTTTTTTIIIETILFHYALHLLAEQIFIFSIFSRKELREKIDAFLHNTATLTMTANVQ